MLPLIPTALIGSYAQPGWYQTVLEAIGRAEYGEADVGEAADDAAMIALTDQERAGVDIVSDGEVRRHDFIMGFYGRLSGLRKVPPRRRLGPALYDSTGAYETVERVSAPRGLGAVDEYHFLASRTAKPIKVAVAGPLTLSNAIQLSGGYRDRDDLLADLMQIVRAELRGLADAGCQFIQVDESYYHHHWADQPGRLAEVYDLTTAGIDGPSLGLHVCFGNLRGRPHSLRTYSHVLPHLRDSRAQVLFLEFANRELAEIDLWQRCEMPQVLAAGVVDVKSAYRERPDDVSARLRRILASCPAERLWAVPDCGFWETPRWLAYRKLEALVQGTTALRAELSGADPAKEGAERVGFEPTKAL